MKNIVINILAAMLFALLPSCAEKDQSTTAREGEIALIAPAEGTLYFGTASSVQTLSFTASAQWKVKFVNSSASTWCSVEPTNGGEGRHTIEVRVSENTQSQQRSAAFNIISGNSQQKVLVVQEAVEQVLPDSLRVLAIGNSFSDDSMWYLYDLLKEVGYEYVKLGNLYIGSCTLQQHAYNITSNASSYTYRVNEDGQWVNNDSYSSVDALKSEDWDMVVMQQASGSSGMPDTYYPYISTLTAKVRELCPDAELMWHMTWAYQGNSNHPEYYKYGYDQMTMYDAIVSAVHQNILTNKDFAKVIPTGTAIQNLRTSIYGDTVTRDGFHLAYDSGRLAASIMWLRALTECDLEPITWTPANYTYTQEQIAAIKESVENAWANPYQVTAF